MVIVANEIRWFSLVISILGGLSKDVEGACWFWIMKFSSDDLKLIQLLSCEFLSNFRLTELNFPLLFS